MFMKSRIYESEKVKNKKRGFGEHVEYYPFYVKDKITGDMKKALITQHELNKCLKRGKKQPEDLENFDSWLEYFD